MTAHLFERLVAAKARLTPVQSQYRIVFDLPDAGDSVCAGILVPDPNWLAAALAGDVLPPIAAYLADQARMAAWCAENDPGQFAWHKIGGASHPYAEPIGPMTEEEAIEYLVMKDLPLSVWADHETANRPRFKIVRTEMVPSDRLYRNAWRLAA